LPDDFRNIIKRDREVFVMSCLNNLLAMPPWRPQQALVIILVLALLAVSTRPWSWIALGVLAGTGLGCVVALAKASPEWTDSYIWNGLLYGAVLGGILQFCYQMYKTGKKKGGRKPSSTQRAPD
jgi:hypothetical protein